MRNPTSSTVDQIAARVAVLSNTAQVRLKWMDFYAAHGGNAH